jgi:hypothetical protein
VTRTRQREVTTPDLVTTHRPAPPLAGDCRESGNRYSHAPSSASECRSQGSAPGPGASSGSSGGIFPTTSPMPHATAMGSRVRRDTSAEVKSPMLTPSKREAHPFSCGHPNPESITRSDAQGPGPNTQPAFPGPPLHLVPITLREANAFVKSVHRHHGPTRGCLFCVAVADEMAIRGVAIIGRPVARLLQDGFTAEVTRLATDGAMNACSQLYAAAWRAARAIGYQRLVTYTLAKESGVSIRAAGWKCLGEAGGGSWNRQDRPRVDLHPTQTKIRWEAVAERAK